MHSDPYLLFTSCLRLYVDGVRAAIRDRLEQELGKDWWEWGVIPALSDDQKTQIRRYFASNRDREPHLHLSPGHFPSIIQWNYNHYFSDAFDNPRNTQRILRDLANLRNVWAHDLTMSWDYVRWGTEMMKHILASLRRDEAVEIENMVRDTDGSDGDYRPPDGLVADHGGPEEELAPRDMPGDEWGFWHELVDSLQITVEVRDDEEDPDNLANVTITVRNTVPDSSDVPAVHFREVVVQNSGTLMRRHDGRREVRELAFGEMEPGATKEATVIVAQPGLIAAEFKVSGVIDTKRLFGFQQTAGMPASVTEPLRQRFLERMEAVGVRPFLDGILEITNTLDSDRSLADVSASRAALREKPEAIQKIQLALNEIAKDFHITRDSTLAGRLSELRNSLEDFRTKLGSLDEAIGKTDLEAIGETKEDIRRVQLAVLRVEDAVKSVLAGS